MTQHLDLDALQAAAKLICSEQWKFQSSKNPGASCNSVVNLAGEVVCDDECYYPCAVEIDHMQFIAAANPAVVLALIDRLRKAEAASMSGHVIVPAEQFLAVLDRSDWRTAKNRTELRAMIAAPDSTPTDSADSEGAKG